MKLKSFLGIFIIMISLNLSAQTPGPITIEKKGMRKSIMQNGKSLDSKQLASILKSNQASSKQYQASKTNSIIGLSSIGVGTVFIGAGFVNTLKAAKATNDNDLAASTDYSNKSAGDMLIGAGFYVVSLPFILMSNSHFKKSINLYNSSNKTGSFNKIDLHVSYSGKGVAVQLRF